MLLCFDTNTFISIILLNIDFILESIFVGTHLIFALAEVKCFKTGK